MILFIIQSNVLSMVFSMFVKVRDSLQVLNISFDQFDDMPASW